MKLSNEYLITRAYRHLGAIERRRNGPPLYGKAEEYFNTALEHASKVPLGLQRSESTAGCYYAIASLNFYKKNYEEAIKNLDKAINDFKEYSNDIGITRSMTKKADAYMALGRQNEAKDLLRKALQQAKNDTHRNQVVRASIGLAKIFVAENKYDKAVEHLVLAKELAKEMNIMTELKEIVELEGKLPQNFRESISP